MEMEKEKDLMKTIIEQFVKQLVDEFPTDKKGREIDLKIYEFYKKYIKSLGI